MLGHFHRMHDRIQCVYHATDDVRYQMTPGAQGLLMLLKQAYSMLSLSANGFYSISETMKSMAKGGFAGAASDPGAASRVSWERTSDMGR
eukprot:272342-Hanusia_phi.AAC.1